MNPDFQNSPEDRLLDELLHEQNQKPDAAFLQQIEAALDSTPEPATRRPRMAAPLRYGLAAAIALSAGAAVWWQTHLRRQAVPVALANESRSMNPPASPGNPGSLRELEKQIQIQEDRVEERRKVLSTIARSKSIIYRGEEVMKDGTREEAIKRGLDAQDYVDAKRDFETDQQKLIELKMKLIGRGGDIKQLEGKPAPVLAAVVPSPAPVVPEVKPEPVSSDRYGSFIDQPWKSPASDPLSTFSIDVDTASYSNVRRMIREGREVPRNAVRIEDCINAFRYGYAAPKDGGAFAVGATLAVCPWEPEHQLVRVAIKGREIDPQQRPASNLVFLIDVSGSMQSPDKLPLLKQSMITLVNQLDERDRVAIVVYAGSQGVVLPSTRLDSEGRPAVLNALSKLEAGGSTNGGAGIQRAYEMAMKEKIEGGVNRVILATDGDFNVGVTGQDALVGMVKERAQHGVYLTVLGYGSGNLNDAMMDAITRDGNGNYFYIDSEREGRKVFMRNLAGTLVTIAKDVKIQIEFNPAKVGGYRLIGYSSRILKNEDFNNDKVDAGDIGAGHTVTAFYELVPPSASTTDALKYRPSPDSSIAADEWLNVKLRHKHPDGNESRKTEFSLKGQAAALDQTEPDFQFATAAALFGMKLRDMDEVKQVAWEQVIELATPGLKDDASEDRAEFVDLVKHLAGTRNPNVPAPAEVVPNQK
jgi:Ca-activated chloride channel family protein